MSYTPDITAGDGAEDEYSVTFPFISRTHIHVYVDGVEDTSITWVSSSLVRLSSVPANGASVIRKRETPTVPYVDFINGATLSETDLDNVTNQAMYVAEESAYGVASALRKDDASLWDAEGIRVTDLGTPTAATDAVTKAYVDGISAAAGNVPTPDDPAANGGSLTAQDGLFSWASVPTTEVGKGKDNILAIVAPTVTDDSAAGYNYGSLWTDNVIKAVWVCVDASVGAAVWYQVSMPVTTQGDMLYRTASEIVRLAIGAAGTTLRGGTVPAYTSGAWELVESWEYSTAVAAVAFENGFDAGYDHEFVLAGCTPDSSDFLTYTTKEAGTYIATSNAYRAAITSNIASTPSSAGLQSTAGYLGSGSIATTEHHTGAVYFYNPADTTKTASTAVNMAANSTGASSLKASTVTCEREAAAASQGIQIAWASSNNFTAGQISHYRRKIT
jgi:hypothetical protein